MATLARGDSAVKCNGSRSTTTTQPPTGADKVTEEEYAAIPR
jgi:hypothetical protein